MVAAATAPDGRRYALLADATGHGLAAAISVLPLLALFYRMTTEGLDGADIIGEFNRQLRESIPTGRFVALSLVCLAAGGRSGRIWVCGTPEAVQIDAWGRIAQRFPSTHLPLGIVDNAMLAARPQEFTWEAGAQILLYSDGLIEAENGAGAHFAQDGLVRALAHTSPAARRDALVGALKNHLDGAAAQDDISFLLLDLL
jgi:serine phosphatase RsbU (regulator of sigma subunit)